ncbi:MAG: DUF4149 domain-containing protein [Rhodobacteraceae bacterium]|nr:DUF4149 domain-containing protein [Paracoccaceae bacterium]
MTLAALFLSALLFGGMALYSFGFAPLVFSQLPGDQAGRFIRGAFRWYYLFVLGVAVVAGAVLAAVDPLGAGLMLGVAVLAVIARQVLMPMINTSRDAQMAGDASAKRRFGQLHGLSVVINFVQLSAVAWVLARFI